MLTILCTHVCNNDTISNSPSAKMEGMYIVFCDCNKEKIVKYTKDTYYFFSLVTLVVGWCSKKIL